MWSYGCLPILQAPFAQRMDNFIGHYPVDKICWWEYILSEINLINLTHLNSCVGNKYPSLRRVYLRFIVTSEQDVQTSGLGIYRIQIETGDSKLRAIHIINLNAVLWGRRAAQPRCKRKFNSVIFRSSDEPSASRVHGKADRVVRAGKVAFRGRLRGIQGAVYRTIWKE